MRLGVVITTSRVKTNIFVCTGLLVKPFQNRFVNGVSIQLVFSIISENAAKIQRVRSTKTGIDQNPRKPNHRANPIQDH